MAWKRTDIQSFILNGRLSVFIEQMNLDSSTVEDIFCNSTLEWLNLSKEQFL